MPIYKEQETEGTTMRPIFCKYWKKIVKERLWKKDCEKKIVKERLWEIDYERKIVKEWMWKNVCEG